MDTNFLEKADTSHTRDYSQRPVACRLLRILRSKSFQHLGCTIIHDNRGLFCPTEWICEVTPVSIRTLEFSAELGKFHISHQRCMRHKSMGFARKLLWILQALILISECLLDELPELLNSA